MRILQAIYDMVVKIAAVTDFSRNGNAGFINGAPTPSR
jgi:hypothetical protein